MLKSAKPCRIMDELKEERTHLRDVWIENRKQHGFQSKPMRVRWLLRWEVTDKRDTWSDEFLVALRAYIGAKEMLEMTTERQHGRLLQLRSRQPLRRESKRERERVRAAQPDGLLSGTSWRSRRKSSTSASWSRADHRARSFSVGNADSTAHLVPQDRVSERICEQSVDTTVPHSVDVPVPPFQEGIEELIKLSSAERISKRTVEQIVDWPVPQIEKQIAEVAKTTPQERFPKRTVVQTEDVPVPQIRQEVVKAVKTVPQERISAKICEQIVDAPVPQAVDEPVPLVSLVSGGN